MGQIKLYKKFYSITITNTGGTPTQNYVLLDPYSLSANTYVAGTGDTESATLIESSLPISQESTGVYFADLDPIFYASDVVYDLVWFVNYINNAPTKKISTRFKLSTNNITSEIEIEIFNEFLQIEL